MFSFTNQKFQVRTTFMFKLNFPFNLPFSILTQSTSHRSHNFSSSNFSRDRQNHSRLHLNLSSKTHESDFILDSNMFLHDSTCKIHLVHPCIKFENFDQNCSLEHEIHRLSYMTSISVLTSNHPIF